MGETDIGLIGIAVAVFLILLDLPVGFSFLFTGIIGLIYMNGLSATLHTIGSTAFQWASDYTFAAIPLFLIMGEFAHTSGISHDLYEFGQRLLGRISGGLAMATICACGGFAALSGSSLATAAAMGSVALPQMRRIGYNISVATGTIAAGGTLGILIPPSIPFVIIGILTGMSISQLLIAGILPGMMMVTLYCSVLYVMCRVRPELGPRAQSYSAKEILAALVNVWPMLIIFGSIMGGIYLGVCTPTEAAAVGAFGSFVFIFLKGRFKGKEFLPSLIQTGITATMMLTMLIGAMIFNIFLATTGLPDSVSAWISNLGVNRYVILATIMIIYLIMGCLMDSLAMVILSIPFFFPIITALEFSPILFGVLAVRAIEIGQITPPVGINVYILKGMCPDVPIEKIFKGVMPFIVGDFISLPILIALPQISLFLPTLMK
jgi:tripartite ATP-independent transporter DctM subunit